MTFEEAFSALFRGEKITVPSNKNWHYGQTFWSIYNQQLMQDETLHINFANLRDTAGIWPTGWEIYKSKLMFSKLQSGQKFQFVGTTTILMRLNIHYKYVDLKTGCVSECLSPNTREVVLEN